jgi:cell division protein FtsW
MVKEVPALNDHRGRFTLNAAAIIVVCAIGLAILGLSILFSATIALKGGPYPYLNKQIAGVFLAAFIAFVVSRIDLEYARRHVWLVGGVTAFLLILVVIPGLGISVKGSRRWLGFGPIRFQVSELGKIAMVFCLAHYLALNQMRIAEFKRGYIIPLGIILAFAGLIVLEPDFGTAALVLVVGLILLFLAGARWCYILPSLGLAVAGFTVMVLHNENRLRRFMAFLDVEGNKQAGTYQLWQSLLAFAVGGTDGVGLGQGRQQLNFLPEAHTDFIFAVIGEELGLAFTLGVVGVFTIIFIAGFLHLRRAPNLFQYLLVSGTILMICLQAIINLGVVTGRLPTKGMSLPFISAGLSNLLLMGVLIGIIVNTQRTWSRTGLKRGGRSLQELS